MLFTAEQMMAAHKSNVDTMFGLAGKAYEGLEKLVALNLQTTKTVMTEAADTTRAALSIKDPQELMALQTRMLQPAAEKAAAYSRSVYDIVSGTNAEVGRVVESTVADGQSKITALVDTAAKSAPAGSENAVAMMKSAVAVANNAYDSVHKASKQAGEAADANFQAMTNTALKAAQSAQNLQSASLVTPQDAGNGARRAA